MSLTHAMIADVYLFDQVLDHVDWPDDVNQERDDDEAEECSGLPHGRGEVGVSLAQPVAGGVAGVLRNVVVRILCAGWMSAFWEMSAWPGLPRFSLLR